ncbi:MAG: fasciclin domain-containing protein [Myxococcota bacterium]
MQGCELPVDTSDGVKVGEATVVTTDIEASNGIIHVIDTVLIPGS